MEKQSWGFIAIFIAFATFIGAFFMLQNEVEKESEPIASSIDETVDAIINEQGVGAFSAEKVSTTKQGFSTNHNSFRYIYRVGDYTFEPQKNGMLTFKYMIKPTSEKSYLETKGNKTYIYVHADTL